MFSYLENNDLGLARQEILEALSTPPDPLVQRIAALMQNLDTWQGSATQLAIDLNLDIDPSQLSRQLFEKQNQEALHVQGLTLTRHPGRLTRSIEITRLEKNSKNAVTPPPSREAAPNPVPTPAPPGPRLPTPGPCGAGPRAADICENQTLNSTKAIQDHLVPVPEVHG